MTRTMHVDTSVLQPNPDDPEWRAFCEVLFHMLRWEGCMHDTRLARRLLTSRGYDADASLALYERTGGYCDCEVLLNTDEYQSI